MKGCCKVIRYKKHFADQTSEFGGGDVGLTMNISAGTHRYYLPHFFHKKKTKQGPFVPKIVSFFFFQFAIATLSFAALKIALKITDRLFAHI